MKRIKLYPVIGFFAGSLLLISCTVGKEYNRPDLALPASYREHGVTLTADTITLPWKNFFSDPILQTLIDKALVKNNDITTAILSIQQTELNYQQAKKGLLPTADLNVGANRTWLSTNSLNGSLSEQFIGTKYMDDYNTSLSVNWEIDIWGKVKMQKKEALSNFFAQRENLQALKTRLITQVAQAYYNLLLLDEQLAIAQKNISLGEETLAMITLQYNSGQVNSVALAQAEAQKKTAELLVPLAQQQIQVQENALSLLCGSYPDKVERHAITSSNVSAVFPNGIPASLLSRRPDVKAAEYAVMAANARTGLSKAAMYPSLSLTPSVGANSFKFNNWFDLPGSMVKTIGANLTQPVFRKKALKTAYEVAQIEQEKAAVQFKQSVMTAVGEVSDAFARIENADQRISLVKEKKTALDKATKDALLLFKNGLANYLEVIVAQSNSLQNELDVIAIQKDKLDGSIELYRALGGGLE